MVKIEDYEFGMIKVDGRVFTSDIIVTPSKIISGWWRKEGHKLFLEDLEKYNVLNEEYDAIVIGTGYNGMMEVSNEVKNKFSNKELYILPTQEAVKKFNELINQGKRVLGLFHITC